MSASRLTLALAALGLMVSACGGTSAAQEIRSNAARANADATAAHQEAAALDAFSADLYRVLARGGGNVVFSPYSVAVALAMTRAGAAGETASQMDAVLHAAIAGDMDAGFNALEQELAKRPGKYKLGDQTLDLELATANRLWGQQGYAFEGPFLDRLASYYGAGMQVVDYQRTRDAARRTINGWVAERTKDKITDLIPDGVLDALTRLVLTNAIYLRANWANKFDKATPGTFHRADGSETQAQLMRLNEQLRYGTGAGYQAVELPYLGGLSMVVVVPDPGMLSSFEKGLDGAGLQRVVRGLAPAHVVLSMPKFQFRSKAQLKDALGELGMPIAFTAQADFSGMTKQERLTIADVLHEAFIAVDEDGTEAAAATAVVMRGTAAPLNPVELKVDRPFLFLIRDNATGATLFMGRVLDPGQ